MVLLSVAGKIRQETCKMLSNKASRAAASGLLRKLLKFFKYTVVLKGTQLTQMSKAAFRFLLSVWMVITLFPLATFKIHLLSCDISSLVISTRILQVHGCPNSLAPDQTILLTFLKCNDYKLLVSTIFNCLHGCVILPSNL